MADHAAKAFTNETVHIDGECFIDCEFKNATLVFSGGEKPIFNGCHFDDCHWQLDGAAQRTLDYLGFLAQNAPDAAGAIVRRIRGK